MQNILIGDIKVMIKAQKCVENLIPYIELPEFQNIGVQKLLLNKKMLLAFDTGTGKTFTYSLLVRALLNRNPEKKHVLVIIHDSLKQVPSDVSNLIAAPVSAFSNTFQELSNLKRAWNGSSVIIFTYECFRNEKVVRFLYDKLMEIESFVVDEAHHISNWDSSDTALMIRAFMKYIPYVAGLSATPMTSHSSQFYQLLNSIDRNLSSHRDETDYGKYDDRYFPVNRSDYKIKGNYKVTLEFVDPMMHQIGNIHGIIFKVIKGTGAVNQVEKLIDLTKARISDDKRIIIYVNYHDTRKWVEQYLDMNGLPFVSLHGKSGNMNLRKDILSQYEEGKVSILVTSISESLNIDSDVVIFYEFTTKLKQVMGRAHRGLEAKELELVFILTKDSAEIEFFMQYVYKRSLIMQRLLGKDYSEFIQVGEEILRTNLIEGGSS